MNIARIPPALRRLVRTRARQRCEYCHSPEWLTGLHCEVDHIIPQAHNGATTAENLCLACTACNAHKGVMTHAQDPETGAQVALFNPRQQVWHEHFAWNEEGTMIVGLTACGRATVIALRFNDPLSVTARELWLLTGKYPPKD